MLSSMEKTGGKLTGQSPGDTALQRSEGSDNEEHRDRWATRVRKELERVVRACGHLTGPHTKER